MQELVFKVSDVQVQPLRKKIYIHESQCSFMVPLLGVIFGIFQFSRVFYGF